MLVRNNRFMLNSSCFNKYSIHEQLSDVRESFVPDDNERITAVAAYYAPNK
jgi:hypothetical protein